MKTHLLKHTTAIMIILLLMGSIFSPLTSLAEANHKSSVTNDDLLTHIDEIIRWKKKSLGMDPNQPLLENPFLTNAGDTSGDWYPIGMGRIGYKDEYNNYLAVISDVVEKRYEKNQKLSDSKATEWHRISLAILASGGDPTDIGQDDNGKSINLIADGTFNRGETISLGRQGLNGWIWGLITLDSMRYEVPEDAYDTRRSIIEEIIKVQLPDGGFSLNQPESDPDMTAMAIQALAPYYNSEETYTYQLSSTNKKVTKKVRTVINEAVERLSELQLDTGDFESMGTPNAESTAQVIVALTALGIDPLTDERFIKNNQNLFQGIMSYVMDDGGFIHSETYDPDNPSSHPNESNTMSSEQVLYALTALYRHREGYRTLYDFRPEMEEELQEQVDSTKQSIDQIPENITSSDRKTIEKAFSKYKNIPVEERSYVYNYAKLAKAMDELEIENSSEPITKNIGINKDGRGTITPLFDNEKMDTSENVFSQEDKAKAKAIPDTITTEYYVEVVRLIDKLENADNYKGNEKILENLQEKKNQIEKIEAEIDMLNQTIVKELYPFNEIGITDRKKVKKIIEHYQNLSSYDQQKVQNYNDVLRAETQINNMIRARVITVIIIFVIGVVTILYIIHVRKRRIRKHQHKMPLNQDGYGRQ